MENFIEEPSNDFFTVYSKSGCPNCRLVKNLLKDKKMEYTEVDCDDFLIDSREEFLSFMKSKNNKEKQVFPIVFYKGNFIGGYYETIDLLDKLLLSFEDVF
jgi:glutaredoxin